MLVFQALYSADISDIITRQFFLPYEGITDESFNLEVIYNGITSNSDKWEKFISEHEITVNYKDILSLVYDAEYDIYRFHDIVIRKNRDKKDEYFLEVTRNFPGEMRIFRVIFEYSEGQFKYITHDIMRIEHQYIKIIE